MAERSKTTIGGKQRPMVGPRKSRTSITLKDVDGQTDPRGSINKNRVSSGKYRQQAPRPTTPKDRKHNDRSTKQDNQQNITSYGTHPNDNGKRQPSLPPIQNGNTNGRSELNQSRKATVDRHDSIHSIKAGNERRESMRSITKETRKDSTNSLRSDSRKSPRVSPIPHPPSTPPSAVRRTRKRTISQQSAHSEQTEKPVLILVNSKGNDTTRHDVGILSCAVSRDQTICITGSGSEQGNQGTIRAWDPHTGAPLGASKALSRRITGVCCSPRYPLLAWTEGEGCVIRFMEMGQMEAEENNSGAMFQIELPGDQTDTQALIPGWNTLNSSAEGNYILATSSSKNSIHVIDMTSGNYEEVPNIHKGAVLGGCFAPTGDKFVTWCSAFTQPFNSRARPDATSEIKIFDMISKQELCCAASDNEMSKPQKGWENKAGFANIRFHPTEPFIACTTHTGKLQLRDVDDLKVKEETQAHTGSTPDLRFTRNGRYVVTCSVDQQVKVWSVPDLQEVASYDIGAEVTCVDTLNSGDGDILINCGDNTGALTVLKLQVPHDDTNGEDNTAGCTAGFSGSIYNSSDKSLHQEDATPKRKHSQTSINQKANRPASRSIDGRDSPAVSPIPRTASRPISMQSSRGNTPRSLVLKNAATDESMQHSDGILSCAISLDQTICVTGSGSEDGENAVIRTWDPLSGKLLGASKPLSQRITALNFSPRYSLLAWSKGEGNEVMFWDFRQLESDQLDSSTLFQINLGSDRDSADGFVPGFDTLASSSEGNNLLATSTKSSSVYIIDMTSGNFDEMENIHRGAVLGACFSPSGDKILTWCSAFTQPFSKSGKTDASSEIKIFDTNTKEEICSAEAAKDSCKPQTGWENRAGFAKVRFHPKQPFVACTTHTGKLQIRDVNTLGIMAQHQAHEGSAPGLQFSRDGRYVVTCSEDHWVKVWSVPELTEQAAYDVGTEATCIDTLVSPEGNLIINCGDKSGKLSALELQCE